MPDDAAPHSFAIDCPTAAIQLDGTGRANVVLTITNTSAATIDGRLRLAGAGSSPVADAWLKVAEPVEQRYKPNESRRFTIAITVPPTQADGTFLFRAETYAVANPNEDFTCGPEMSVTVKRAAAPVRKHFPMWIPIVAAVVVLLIIGIIVAVSMSHNGGAAEAATTTQPGEPVKDKGTKEPGSSDPGTKAPGKDTGPGPKKTSEIEPPTGGGEVRQGAITVPPGAGFDLASGHEVPSNQRADMDVLCLPVSGGHMLESANGARLARTPNATAAECESVLSHSAVTSIRLEGLKTSDLIACRSRQGVIYVLHLLVEPASPAAAVEVHFEQAEAGSIKPENLREPIQIKK